MARWVRRRDRDHVHDVVRSDVQDVVGSDVQDVVRDDGGEVLLFRSRDTDDDRDGDDRDSGDGTGIRVEQVPPRTDADADEFVVGEIVDEDESRVPVNLPDEPGRYVVPWQRDTERRAVVPVWLRDKAEAKTAARWAAGYAGHHVAFHAVRVPKYAGTLLARSPRGLGRTLGATARWVTDAEAVPLRQDAVRHADAAEYMRLARLRSDRVRLRSTVLVAALSVLGVAGLMVLLTGPGWLPWLLGTG